MGQAISPVTNKPYGFKRVCAVWGIARASVYRKMRKPDKPPRKRGPKPIVEESALLEHIKGGYSEVPF